MTSSNWLFSLISHYVPPIASHWGSASYKSARKERSPTAKTTGFTAERSSVTEISVIGPSEIRIPNRLMSMRKTAWKEVGEIYIMRFIIIKLFSLQWILFVSSQGCRRELKLPSVGNLQIVRHRDHFKDACDFQSSAEWPVRWRSLTVGGQLGSHLVVLRQPFKRLHNCRGNCTLESTWIQVETTDWTKWANDVASSSRRIFQIFKTLCESLEDSEDSIESVYRSTESVVMP